MAISRGFLVPLKGTEIGAALDNAFGKVTANLPAPVLSHMKSLKDSFAVGLGPHKKYAAHRETIEKICDAIEKKRNIQMRYRAVSRGETTRREVSPYQLWYSGGSLYLIGWCHKRESERMFAVDRIESIGLTDNPFSVPFTFDAREFMKDAFGAMRGAPEEVDLVFEPRTAVWVGEKIWHPSQTIEKLPRKRLRLRLRVAVTPELAAWVTSFGGEAEAIRPKSLREAVQRAGEEIVRRYGRG
ncbi:MAG: WYL domain-containing protein [Nitrospirae bacterium]|nr:WYL domain-containing protein [Nitrospirota bacterium]